MEREKISMMPRLKDFTVQIFGGRVSIALCILVASVFRAFLSTPGVCTIPQHHPDSGYGGGPMHPGAVN